MKPHDLHHGVAMEILVAQHDLEAVRAMLGHVRLETTQIYAQIRPAQLKRAVEFSGAPELPPEASPRYGDVEVHRLVSAGVETEPRSQARCGRCPAGA